MGQLLFVIGVGGIQVLQSTTGKYLYEKEVPMILVREIKNKQIGYLYNKFILVPFHAHTNPFVLLQDKLLFKHKFIKCTCTKEFGREINK